MTLRAELARDRVVFDVPVIAPQRVPDFQREWHRRPELRALIRAAGRLDEAEVARSKMVTPDGRPWASVRTTGEGKKPHVAVQRAITDAFGRL